MINTIIIDIDNTLVNWRGPFNHWAKKHGFLSDVNWWGEDNYTLPNSSKLPLGRLANIFNETHFIESLPPIEGSIIGVRKLFESGYDIRVCTSFTDNYQSIKMRAKNLENLFGVGTFREIYSLIPTESKTKVLNIFDKSSTVFIDDLSKHIDEALDIGYSPENLYLMPQIHNIPDRDRMKKLGVNVLPWSDIVKNIRGDI